MTASFTVLAVAILLGVAAQLLLKAGSSAETFVAQLVAPASVGGLALFAVSSVLYMYAIRRIPLSVAVPLVSTSYILVALASYWLYHEPLQGTKLLGIALICGGVFLVARHA